MPPATDLLFGRLQQQLITGDGSAEARKQQLMLLNDLWVAHNQMRLIEKLQIIDKSLARHNNQQQLDRALRQLADNATAATAATTGSSCTAATTPEAAPRLSPLMKRQARVNAELRVSQARVSGATDRLELAEGHHGQTPPSEFSVHEDETDSAAAATSFLHHTHRFYLGGRLLLMVRERVVRVLCHSWARNAASGAGAPDIHKGWSLSAQSFVHHAQIAAFLLSQLHLSWQLRTGYHDWARNTTEALQNHRYQHLAAVVATYTLSSP